MSLLAKGLSTTILGRLPLQCHHMTRLSKHMSLGTKIDRLIDCIVAEASTLSLHGHRPHDKGHVTSHGIPVHGSVFLFFPGTVRRGAAKKRKTETLRTFFRQRLETALAYRPQAAANEEGRHPREFFLLHLSSLFALSRLFEESHLTNIQGRALAWRVLYFSHRS